MGWDDVHFHFTALDVVVGVMVKTGSPPVHFVFAAVVVMTPAARVSDAT